MGDESARDVRDAALDGVRALILASEQIRFDAAGATGVAMTDLTALTYLRVAARGPSELAAAVGITTSSATALVDRLERAGHVNRTRHPKDRRRFIVNITPKGEALVATVRAMFGRAVDCIQADQLPEIVRSLETLTTAIRESQQHSTPARTDHTGVECRAVGD